jgi:hypothetical protein
MPLEQKEQHPSDYGIGEAAKHSLEGHLVLGSSHPWAFNFIKVNVQRPKLNEARGLGCAHQKDRLIPLISELIHPIRQIQVTPIRERPLPTRTHLNRQTTMGPGIHGELSVHRAKCDPAEGLLDRHLTRFGLQAKKTHRPSRALFMNHQRLGNEPCESHIVHLTQQRRKTIGHDQRSLGAILEHGHQQPVKPLSVIRLYSSHQIGQLHSQLSGLACGCCRQQ